MDTSGLACPHLMCECFLNQIGQRLVWIGYFYPVLSLATNSTSGTTNTMSSPLDEDGAGKATVDFFFLGGFFFFSLPSVSVWNLCQMLQPDKPTCQPLKFS